MPLPDAMNPLITVDEHEAAARERYRRAEGPEGTGVACPKCGTELVIWGPGIILLSAPPKIRAECPNCKHHQLLTF